MHFPAVLIRQSLPLFSLKQSASSSPAIIRAVNTTDAMTATIEEIPYPLLHTICNRITREVEGINGVFMDITPKPIATIEFE